MIAPPCPDHAAFPPVPGTIHPTNFPATAMTPTIPQSELFQTLDSLQSRIRLLMQTPAADHSGIWHLEKEADATVKQLVSDNLRLVYRLAGKLVASVKGAGHLEEDMVQEGVTGLMKAVAAFDPRRGNRFSTFAHPWIKGAMMRALTKQLRTIRIPEGQLAELKKLWAIQKRFREESGRAPSAAELAGETGYSEKRVRRLLAGDLHTESLDAPLHDGEGATLMDVTDSSPAHDASLDEDRTWQAELIGQALAMLPARQREMFELRHGHTTGRSVHFVEIGRRFGVSGERVRQIINALAPKIRRFVMACDHHDIPKAAELAGLVKPAAPAAGKPARRTRKRRGPGLRLRGSTAKPNHHLWQNHGIWSCNFVIVSEDGASNRIRTSLGTKNVEVARRLRDQKIRRYLSSPAAAA